MGIVGIKVFLLLIKCVILSQYKGINRKESVNKFRSVTVAHVNLMMKIYVHPGG